MQTVHTPLRNNIAYVTPRNLDKCFAFNLMLSRRVFSKMPEQNMTQVSIESIFETRLN